jgi:hypothetical protein
MTEKKWHCCFCAGCEQLREEGKLKPDECIPSNSPDFLCDGIGCSCGVCEDANIEFEEEGDD